MGTYAAKTTVSAEQSRSEIERTLSRYGAASFAYGWQQDRAMVQFVANDRHIRFVLPLPDPSDRSFTYYLRGRTEVRRAPGAAKQQWEQAVRQRWRALALCIKAKLEAVESGIATFEEEFLAYVVLPDGSTVGEWVGPQIADAYATGEMPSVLPALSRGD